MPVVKEGGVNVTPLIDVIMCLIIFFMLVAKIGVATGAVKMELPETLVGVKIEKLGPNLILNIKDPNLDIDPATGKVNRDSRTGRPIRKSRLDPEVTITPDVGKPQTKEIKLEQRTASGVDEPLTRVIEAALKKFPELSITLRCQREIDYATLSRVIEKISKASVDQGGGKQPLRVSKINFAAVDKKSSK
jgi:biopolymer transport protein ExbD